MRSKRKLAICLCAWALLLLPLAAQAHPELDAGKRLATELEFEPALAAFERALVSGSLTREELIELLAERALLLHALHRQKDLVNDFVWLSALSPDHRLDLRAPPELTAIWTSVRDQGRGPLKVELSTQVSEQGELEAKASMNGTVPEGARARIVMRRPDGDFQVVDSSEVNESVPEGGLELYAEAIGLGYVVVAQHHSPEHPLHVGALASTVADADPVPHEESSSPRSTRRRRNWLIGGAAAVAAIVLVSVVVATRAGGEEERTSNTTLKPMVSF